MQSSGHHAGGCLYLSRRGINYNLMNYLVLIAAGIFMAALVILVIRRNRKDRQEFEQQLNQDYKKPDDEENENDTSGDKRP